MRALYPGALKLKRYTYRDWAIDVVSYESDRWVAMCFPPGVMEGHRLAPFSLDKSAFSVAKLYVDNAIANATVEPPPAEKKRGTKRPKRKKKKLRKAEPA